MKKLLVLIAILSVGFPFAFSQTYTANLIPNGGNPGGLNAELDYSTSGWTAIAGPSQSTNSWSPSQIVPFSFRFYGALVNKFKVSQNGLLTFDINAGIPTGGNNNLPDGGLPNSTLACFWDYFTNTPPTDVNDYIYTKVFGSAPNRQLWIRWHSLEYGSPSMPYAYFACVLEESTNNIYMVDMNYNSSGGSVSTTVGIQLDATTALQYGSSNIDLGTGGSDASNNSYYEFTYTPPISMEGQQVFGGSSVDMGQKIRQTFDGGYIITGESSSIGLGYDAFLTKTDANGNEEWTKTYGGSSTERGYDVQQLGDKGYIMLATTNSYGAGLYDVFLVRTDEHGDTLWTKVYGGTGYDYGWAIKQTLDGGYIITGQTNSYTASTDVFLLKVDENGMLEWSETYGSNVFSSDYDSGYDVIQTADGGYGIVGSGEIGSIQGDNLLFIKTDSLGVVEISNEYGTDGLDYGRSIIETEDGGFVLGGSTSYGFGGTSDALIIRLDALGDTVWKRSYGGINQELLYDMVAIPGGGYLASGTTESFGAGGVDYFGFKIDESGMLEWSKAYGGLQDDYATGVIQTGGGGFAFIGYTYSFGAGNKELYFVKTDAYGNTSCNTEQVIGNEMTLISNCDQDPVTPSTSSPGVVTFNTATSESLQSFTDNPNCTFTEVISDNFTKKFQKTFGGTGDDYPYSVIQTRDGEYLIAGYTENYGAGMKDGYAVMTDAEGNLKWSKAYGGTDDEEFKSVSQTMDGGYIFAGHTGTVGAGGKDMLIIKTDEDGVVEWSEVYGSSNTDYAEEIQPTSDGGYIIAGTRYGSNQGMFLLKIGPTGGQFWSNVYYNPSSGPYELGYSVVQTDDDGYAALGYTGSYGAGGQDYFLVRTDEYGDTLWTRAIGGTENDFAYKIKQTIDGGFVVVGKTYNSSVGYLIRVVKLDSNGNVEWSKDYGSSSSDGYDIEQLDDGAYIVMGAYNSDLVLFKLDPNGSVIWARNHGGSSMDYGYAGTLSKSDNGFAMVGRTTSFGAGTEDVLIIKTNELGVSGDCHNGPLSLGESTAAVSSIATSCSVIGNALSQMSYSPTETNANSTEGGLEVTSSMISTDVSCNGGNNGAANVSVTGGLGPYSFTWSNGSTTDNVTTLSAGFFTVSVTDLYNCQITDTVTIHEPAIMTLAMASTDVTCYAGADGTAAAIPSGGTPPYNYYWNTGQVDSSITSLFPGNYYVNVFDVNNCLASNNVTITGPSALTSVIVNTNATCYGGTGDADLTAAGGTSPYTYSWSNGAGSEDITGATAGTYGVTITDNCGITISDSVTISEPSIISATMSQTNISCNGYSDGTATVTATDGTPPYTYAWSNGSATQNITLLGTGTYSVTVTDACGINDNNSVTITEPVVLTTTIAKTNASCFGMGDGTATVTATGGTAPYYYTWNNGQTSSMAIGLFAGIQSVNVVDANGCLSSNSIHIGQPGALTTHLSATMATCNGGNDGGADLTVAGGTSPFTYLWSNGATSEDLSSVATGTYNVTVIDSCGGSIIDSVYISQPAALAITLLPTDVTCNGNSDGEVVLMKSGGVAPFNYAWSNGASTKNISALSPGPYWVTVTDACGSISDSTMIFQPLVMTTTITQSDVTCNGLGNGIATIMMGGGTPPFNFLWNTGQTQPTALGLFPGTYTVNVVDSNGCLASDLVTITEPDAIDIILAVADATCNNADGSIAASVTGGVTPYVYSWSSGGTSSSEPALAGGTYSLMLTDDNGCLDSADATVPITAIVQEICMVTVDSLTSSKNEVVWEKPTVTNIDSFKIYRDISGTYTHVGSVPYAMESFFVDTTNGINPQVTSYRYKLAVLDACGNEGDMSDFHETMHLQINSTGGVANLSWDAYEGFDTTFKYRILIDSTGSGFQVMDSVSNTNFTYTDINPPANADYKVAVVQPWGGCTADKAKTYNTSKSNTSSSIGPNDQFTGTTSTTMASQGLCDGTATVIPSGGTAPYTYQWDGNTGNQVTQTATNLCAGTYSVIVYDSKSNSLTLFATVSTVPGTLELDGEQNALNIFPNPYSGETQISYTLNTEAMVVLEVYNVLGEKIETLANEQQGTGKHSYLFGAGKKGYTNGVYMVRLTANEETFVKRIVELK